MITLTNQQARQFVLLKQGLIDNYKFIGKKGAYDFIRQAGCIQFDPIDSCGKNAELTLQSRVKGFTKKMLYDLLYDDRIVVDYPDKMISIMPMEDWPYFERYRAAARENGLQFDELSELEEKAKEYICENGPVSSKDLPMQGSIYWHSVIHWSGNWSGKSNAARAVLEQLYSTGELIIHHKNGARKYYDLADKYISSELLNARDPLPDELEHLKWRILRRIGSVGLMWNRPSDAWLNIWGLTTPIRNEVFSQLIEEGKILEIKVENIKGFLYCQAEDLPLIETVLQNKELKMRCELIAPLDCIMWDRKLIFSLFNFQYGWEIYTPPGKRKYGYYVLPILYGDSFIGRIEAVADAKASTLTVKNIWYEYGIKETVKLKKVLEERLSRFAKFNNCDIIDFIYS